MKLPFKIPKFVKNKYFFTALVFFSWIFFFDQNNILAQLQYKLELSKLNEEKEFYQNEIHQIESDLEELKTNPQTLEKFAREKYLMKKDKEELFVLVKE